MANYFYREAIDGADDEIWAQYEIEQNRAGAIGQLTTRLYDDAGVLKCAIGKIGFDNGSNRGVIDIDTITDIPIAGLTVSRWAQVEISVSGTLPSFEITSIAAAATVSTLPIQLTNNYDETKQGFYITATKRLLGVVWIDGAGNLDGIVNCLAYTDSYLGKSDSNANDFFTVAQIKIVQVPIGSIIAWHKDFSGAPALPDGFLECDGSVISDSDSPFDGNTLPNLNGGARFLRGSGTSGTLQNDAFQSHAHGDGTNVNKDEATMAGGASETVRSVAGGVAQQIMNDGIGGVPRTATETRPINMSVVWIMRIK